MRRFVLPVAVSAVIVLWGPFIGQIRDAIKQAFPGRFVAVVAGAVGATLAVALLAAIFQIRAHRARRYGAFALSAALFGIWMLAFQTGNAEVDVVERFHFIEYGLITVLFFRAVRSFGDSSIILFTLLYGTLVGTLEEWVQWLVPTRVGDVRDVFLNLYAVTCGLLFSFGLQPPNRFSWPMQPRTVRRTLRFAAVVLALFAGFFHCAHLGYEVRDDEIGRFRSYFTAERLADLRSRRTAAWRLDPPERLQSLALEDYYLTEGGWHAQARNTAYTARDFGVAWKENRILEKYYDPFLDLRSFSSHVVHRWAPAQRAEVEAGAAAQLTAAYVSQAGLARVWIRPRKPVFWSAMLTLAAALWALAGLRHADYNPSI